MESLEPKLPAVRSIAWLDAGRRYTYSFELRDCHPGRKEHYIAIKIENGIFLQGSASRPYRAAEENYSLAG
ncbi:MAG: hypothetical protein M3Y80_04675, partial [Verrucomicrobiota bacterium]|nr:hypothetical protein [Verrucomicrobiota bacterium]